MRALIIIGVLASIVLQQCNAGCVPADKYKDDDKWKQNCPNVGKEYEDCMELAEMGKCKWDGPIPQKQQVVKPGKGLRSYWVFNGHSSYLETDNKPVISKYPTHFFCPKGTPFIPDHSVPYEILGLTFENKASFDQIFARKNEKHAVAAMQGQHDYILNHCKVCGANSGIFRVHIEDDGTGKTKINSIYKFDLSGIAQGKHILLSDLVNNYINKEHGGPLFSLGCRSKYEGQVDPSNIVQLSTIQPKKVAAKALDFAEWITDDYSYEEESGDAYDRQFESYSDAGYNRKSLHHEHVYGGYDHDRYNGYGEYNYDYEQTKLLLAIPLILLTICIVCIGCLCCAGFGGIAGWFIKDASNGSIKNRKHDYIRALNDNEVSEI